MSGGGERYSILLFGGENINFLQTHSQTFGPAWNKENTFSADTEPPAGGSWLMKLLCMNRASSSVSTLFYRDNISQLGVGSHTEFCAILLSNNISALLIG